MLPRITDLCHIDDPMMNNKPNITFTWLERSSIRLSREQVSQFGLYTFLLINYKREHYFLANVIGDTLLCSI